MTLARAVRLLLLTALSLPLACGHGEPFAVPLQGTDQPFQPGVPTRLTYSGLNDSEASWLPDGSALVYSATRLDFPDTTTCLEILPRAGGSATATLCPFVSVWRDSTRALQAGAVSRAGRVAYLRSARATPDLGWARRQLELTSLEPGAPRRVLQVIPFASASVPPHNGVSQIRWLDDDRFVYRAGQYYLVYPCKGNCPPLEADTGLFVVLVDLRADPPEFTYLQATSGASSVAADGSDAILFTLSGDSRVYREVLSTGAVTVFFDFGVGRVADGVQVTGTRLVAVVDGTLRLVNVLAGTSVQIDPGPYVHPTLSPDGKRLVAEKFRDLWLFDLP